MIKFEITPIEFTKLATLADDLELDYEYHSDKNVADVTEQTHLFWFTFANPWEEITFVSENARQPIM